MLTSLLPQSSLAVLHQSNPRFNCCIVQKRSVNDNSYQISAKKSYPASPKRMSLKSGYDGHKEISLLCPFILRLVKSDRDTRDISVPMPVDNQELTKNFTKRYQNRLQPLVLVPRSIGRAKTVEISVQKYKQKSSFRHWSEQSNNTTRRRSSTLHTSLKTMPTLADNSESQKTPKQSKKNRFNIKMKIFSTWREATLGKPASEPSSSTSTESYAHNKSFFHDPNLSYDMLDNE